MTILTIKSVSREALIERLERFGLKLGIDYDFVGGSDKIEKL